MRHGFAFDMQAVCSGFVYAVTTADLYIRGGLARRVLVIGAETFSRILDWNDRSTCVLFGDGAGALVLEAAEHVEWCEANPATLELALTAWRPSLPPDVDAAQVAGVLAEWSGDRELASRRWLDRVTHLAAKLTVH